MRFPKAFGRPALALLLLIGVAALTTHAQSAAPPEQSARGPVENTSVGGFVARRQKANGRIVYQSIRNNTGEIFVTDADGSNNTQLTDNTVDDLSPGFSPDGTKIAFASRRD